MSSQHLDKAKALIFDDDGITTTTTNNNNNDNNNAVNKGLKSASKRKSVHSSQPTSSDLPRISKKMRNSQ